MTQDLLANGEPGTTRPLIGLGHSHLTALQIAFDRSDRRARGQWGTFVQLHNDRYRPLLELAANPPRLHPQLEADLGQLLGEVPGRPAIILCASGNEYQFWGMVRHARPFDLWLPDYPNGKLAEGAEILPAELLAARFENRVRQVVRILAPLKRIFGDDADFYAIESPPPIPDTDFIMQGHTIFAAELRERGVSPAALRHKLWTLQSRAFEKHWTALGVPYLRRPDSAVDADNFLRPEAWHPDSVHAMPWYGEHVLEQIDAVLARSEAAASEKSAMAVPFGSEASWSGP